MKTFKLALLSVLLALGWLSLAAPSLGEVVGWGANDGGQATGVLSFLTSTGIVTLNGKTLGDAVALAAGPRHAIALKRDGSVASWGSNQYGQTTLPAGLSNVVAIAAGQLFSLALKRDGTVVAWGHKEFQETAVPARLQNVIGIAAGKEYGLALKEDGSVAAWGNYRTTVPAMLTNVVAIAAGGSQFDRNLALKGDGTVVGWGSEPPPGDASPPAGLSNVVAISVGECFSLALKNDGTIVGWGVNDNGEATGVPTTNAPYVSSGLVKISGQVLTNVVAISTGNEYSSGGIANRYSLALRRDGTVVAWGEIGFHPPPVPAGLSNVVAIAAGGNFCLAITTNVAVAERFRH